MAVFNKPEFNNVWANTGTKIAPDPAKVNLGWVVEIPPHEYDNWMNNRQDALLAHLNQAGVVSWDATVEYQANSSYVQGTSTGNVYRALTTNTGVDPELDVNGNWSIAFESAGLALLKSQNLADVPDKAQARTNLGIATTADYDARYLIKNQNLGDVPNKATARNNLDTFSKQEVLDLLATAQQAGEVAHFATNVAPAGWLPCNGAAVSRTTYARLFTAIGTRWGAGNGTTTFNVPDLRGEFLRGWDNGRGLDVGRAFGSVQNDQNKLHSHSVSDPGHVHQSYGERGIGQGASGPNTVQQANGSQSTTLSTTGITLGADGGNESRPRNIALLLCIRT